MDKLFLPLMALGLVSPLLAIMAAFIFFFRHRERAAPNGRVSAIGYIIAILLVGIALSLITAAEARRSQLLLIKQTAGAN